MAHKPEDRNIQIPASLRIELLEIARTFRKAPTRGEEILWSALRNRQLCGVKFRRQQPIGPFIVDFFAPSRRLVIEVDGPIHLSQIEADRARQEILEDLGLQVLRIDTSLVEQDLPAVLARIESALTSQDI